MSSAAAEGTRLAREADDLYGLEIMLLNVGSAALIAGDLGQARPLFTESLGIAQRIDDRVAQFYLLDALGCHAALSGRGRLAAQLLGAAERARAEVGANIMPFLAPVLAQAEKLAVAALGRARFEAEFETGRRLGRDAATELALGKPAHATPAPAGNSGNGLLGARETDVARLVADGLTNRQIGARLFISERTVDSHVRAIMNKLGVNSRARIAAWMTAADQ